MKLNRVLASAAFIGLAVCADAVVKPNALIGDNMVLQQQTDARLWGTATPGSSVTATTSWNGKTYTAKTDADGRWALTVATPEASYTPYEITLSDADGDLTLRNVLIGEVWLASGQSNMQMPLKGFGGCCVKDGFKEVAGSREWADKVRFFNVPLTQSYTPLDDTEGRWDVPSPDTAPEFSAVAWHYAKELAEVLDVPVGIVSAAYGGARVESWMPRDILETYEDVSLDPKDIEPTIHYQRPLLMYNAMFNPVSPYTYKGIIWYQGCSNVGDHDTYPQRLATMITRWRSDIGLGDIPFYAVEIAPYQFGPVYEPGKASPTEGGPQLREAQWKAVSLVPNAAMISTNDLVQPFERFNIHPGDKEAVGRRLSELALNKTYGKKQFMVNNPRYRSHRVDGDKMIVAIQSDQNGVCRNYDIRGFEIAGEDRVFYPAEKADFMWQTNEVVLSNPNVPEPVAVRYCYRDFLPGTLYGGNFLPLILFRTDNW